MRTSSLTAPTLLTFQNKNISNPKRIATIFNTYFSTISKNIQAKIKYRYKNNTDYLTNENQISFFSHQQKKRKLH